MAIKPLVTRPEFSWGGRLSLGQINNLVKVFFSSKGFLSFLFVFVFFNEGPSNLVCLFFPLFVDKMHYSASAIPNSFVSTSNNRQPCDSNTKNIGFNESFPEHLPHI